MFKTGILGYGGGPSVIPLIQYEAVTKYKWLDQNEFGEILALANALPGPIATKMAAYLGYRMRKSTGAFVALLAHILPTSLAMVALISLVRWLSGSAIIAGMIGAVTPVIAVMLGIMAYEFAERAVRGLGLAAGLFFFLVSFLLMNVLSIHPAIVIALFIAYGIFHIRFASFLRRKRKKRRSE
ncbi:chromate transporter [Paenibacillus nasutitermitis]